MSDPSIDSESTVVDSEEPAAEPEEVEVDTPEPEQPVDLDAESLSPEDDQESDEDQPESETEESEEDESPEVDMREYDFGGKKLSFDAAAVPVELADELQAFAKSIEGDYTKSKQAIAEERKSLQTKEESVTRLNGLNGEALETYSQGLKLKDEITQLEGIDVNALWQSNPDQARQVSDALSAKQAEFQQTVAKVGQQEQAFEQAHSQELTRRLEEGKAILDKKYKNFTTEKAPELIKYAVGLGMSQQEAEGYALNPQGAEFAYKAMLYDRMQQKTLTKAKPKPKKATPIKAPKGKGSSSNKSGDPSKMSMEAYSKWRAAGNG